MEIAGPKHAWVCVGSNAACLPALRAALTPPCAGCARRRMKVQKELGEAQTTLQRFDEW